ncbi:MAG: twin-arginine translocation signal domain-containing protein, partial [Alphaproteobacteria bacterium]|nr:twin-arginine translocation signal domain-containing protein [Alphaproteobacteria bacterium]
MTTDISRRGFLKAAGATMLVIGIRPDGALAAGHGSAQLTPFVKID